MSRSFFSRLLSSRKAKGKARQATRRSMLEVYEPRNLMASLPPVLGASGGVIYNENASAIVLVPTAALNDPDTAVFTGGTFTARITQNAGVDDRLTIRNQGTAAGQIGVANGSVSFGGTTIGTATGGSSGNALSVSLNNNASIIAVRALMRNVAYQNTGENPGTLTRRVTFQLADGTGASSDPATAFKNITVRPTNDAPTLSGTINPFATYTELDAPVFLVSNASVSDPDNTEYDGARLTVTPRSGNTGPDRFNIRANGSGSGQVDLTPLDATFQNVRVDGVVVGKVRGGNGGSALEVTFNANATLNSIQTVTRRVAFTNVSAAPSEANRTFEIQVTDGNGGRSAILTATVAVTSVNSAPTLALGGGIGHIFGGPPTTMVPGASLNDVDAAAGANFAGGNITARIASARLVNDVLAVGGGSGGTTFTLSDGTNGTKQVKLGSRVIGTIETAHNGAANSTDLRIDLTAEATLTIVRDLLHGLTFDGEPGLFGTERRLTVEFSVADGDGGVSATQTRNISVGIE